MNVLDKDKCKSFRNSQEIEKSDSRTYYTYTNPLTKRKLKQCSDKYNEINENCNTIIGMESNSKNRSKSIKKHRSVDPLKTLVDT